MLHNVVADNDVGITIGHRHVKTIRGNRFDGDTAYCMKSPPVQYSDDEARNMTEQFIAANAGQPEAAPTNGSGER